MQLFLLFFFSQIEASVAVHVIRIYSEETDLKSKFKTILIGAMMLNTGNTSRGSITIPLTSGLTGLESAV